MSLVLSTLRARSALEINICSEVERRRSMEDGSLDLLDPLWSRRGGCERWIMTV